MKIAVLMTCHNRVTKTLACLRSLVACCRSPLVVAVDVYLVDDGSSDGTSERVSAFAAEHFLSLMRLFVIRGSGALYWAKGMALAWKAAVATEGVGEPALRYDYFLWLNDDTILRADALANLLKATGSRPVLVSGELVDGSGSVVYGLGTAEGLCGNCVLVPHEIYENVGVICDRYAHAWADYDYGLKVMAAGYDIVSSGVVGRTEWHELRPSLKGKSLRERVAYLYDPKGWNVHDLWLLRIRNRGILAAIVSCCHLVLHVLMGERRS